ncbi:Diacetyl reductase [(S)-acetoin forming] [Pseudoclavibacter triregionum]|nr:Diacetyl reductase [(S)-acetoin forming] [Pseudoclavibacter triregionum]
MRDDGPMKTAIVTGAARGIGRATALRLAKAGYLVGAFDLDEAGVEDLASSSGRPERFVTGRLDVTDADAWGPAIARVTERSGGALDVLVNNAGILVGGRFEEQPVARRRSEIEVNVLGVLHGCHAAHDALAKARGIVVNLCSASAIYGQPEIAAYSASKFAVRGLTEALDLEWAKEGIRVRAVWPLWVDTGLLAGAEPTSTRTLGVRLGPDDVAKEILRVVRRPPRLAPHRPVGLQARAFHAVSEIAPSWAQRAVNRLVNRA